MTTDHAGVFALRIPELASARPDDVFLEEVDGERRTYRELHERGLAWCAGVQSLGLEPGEPVLTMIPTSLDAIEAWTGIAYAHGLEAPVNPAFRGELLRHVLEDSQARIAVVHRRFLDDLGPALVAAPNVETLVVVGGDDPEPRVDGLRTLTVDALLAAGGEPTLAPIERHHISTLLYTSGTTGRSKGVMVPWAQLDQASFGQFLPGELAGDDVMYSFYPPFHVTWKAGLTSMARVGGRFVFREQFKTDRFWDDVRRYGATTVVLLSAMITFLDRQDPRPDDTDTTLRNVVMVPVIPEVEQFKRRFGVRVKALWNMTESSTPISSENWDVSDYRSCGRARAGYDVRIVDDLDRPVPTGEAGELIVRADEPWTQMAGYWRNPEATVEAWRNHWLHTGDIMRQDEHGNFFFVDRKKDVIRRRGENISSQEVENAVFEHPDVLECAALAVPSEWGEDEVMVFATPKPGCELDPAALDDFLEPRIAAFMRPRYLEVVAELPKTPTAKVRKVELRERGVGPGTWDREHHRPSRRSAGAKGTT